MSKKNQIPKVFYTLEALNTKTDSCELIAKIGRLDKARKKMREIGHFSLLYSRYYDKDDKELYIMKWELSTWKNYFFSAIYYN